MGYKYTMVPFTTSIGSGYITVRSSDSHLLSWIQSAVNQLYPRCKQTISGRLIDHQKNPVGDNIELHISDLKGQDESVAHWLSFELCNQNWEPFQVVNGAGYGTYHFRLKDARG